MNDRDKPRVLALHFGGLGDLVLVSELIGSLKSSRPEWTVTLVCRSEFAAIAGLFPIAPDEVIGLELNPYLAESPSAELRRTLESVAPRFQGLRADILIDASLRPTWLTWFLNALLEPGVSFCCAGAREPEALLSIVREWFALPRRELIDLGPPPEMHERDRYGLLLDYLGIPRVPAFPWRPPPRWETEARRWMAANGLPERGFVVCFPGGTAATSLKRWPRANFIRIIDSIQSQGFPVLLLGESSEREELAGIALDLAGAPAPLFCGDSASLPLAAAVLSRAAGYLGNDTGPAHLAQAYGVPGVAVFGGGGQWPRYAPWAAGSIALVHPLPCFGCNWDCFLGRGLCVESVPVEAVANALSIALKQGRQPPCVVSVPALDSAIFPLLADASARYRSAQTDRARRMEIILELTRANQRLEAGASRANALRAENEARIGELEKAASDRLALLETVHAEASVQREELKRLTAGIADREKRIADLQTIAEERLAVIERIGAEAAARLSMIEELTAAVREREARIGGLEQALAAQTRDETVPE
jgi:heptosyltransferase-3